MSVSSIPDAGVVRQVPAVTRRRLIGAGALATLAAAVAGLVPTSPAEAAPLPPAADVPPIDRADALLAELAAIMAHLDDRDIYNVGHNLDIMYRASEGGPERFAAWLADEPLEIGEGNRPADRSDAADALTRQVAVTHAAVVARLADLDAAGDRGGMYTPTDAVNQARQEVMTRYGDEVGRAIERAGFLLHLHRKYHGGGDAVSCERCFEESV